MRTQVQQVGHIVHPFGPVYNANSSVLILGTMASPASRQAGFYYGHPQNRFWRIMGDLFGQSAPSSVKERIEFCHAHRIALWDVLYSCEICGADDASIRNPQPQPIADLLVQAPIRCIFTTGSKASVLYRKLLYPITGMQALSLPSTSPANCRFYSYESLVESYRAILTYCT